MATAFHRVTFDLEKGKKSRYSLRVDSGTFPDGVKVDRVYDSTNMLEWGVLKWKLSTDKKVLKIVVESKYVGQKKGFDTPPPEGGDISTTLTPSPGGIEIVPVVYDQD